MSVLFSICFLLFNLSREVQAAMQMSQSWEDSLVLVREVEPQNT